MATLPANFPWGLGGDEETASLAEATGETIRLAQYLKGKPHVEALLDKLGAQCESLADAIEGLDSLRVLTNATGKQLDLYGAIVGQARAGQSDSEYLRRIKARVLLNKCSGTVEEIYAILRLVFPLGGNFTLTDSFPAGFALRYLSGGLTTEEADSIMRFIHAARAAGVRGLFFWLSTDLVDTFTFDGTPAQALDVGLFSGAAFLPGVS